jgi:hypothetical protein
LEPNILCVGGDSAMDMFGEITVTDKLEENSNTILILNLLILRNPIASVFILWLAIGVVSFYYKV